MKEFIEYIAKILVDRPNEVLVTEMCGEKTVYYSLKVGSGEAGKVIGKHGQTADSIRMLVAAVSAKQGRRTFLEILD